MEFVIIGAIFLGAGYYFLIIPWIRKIKRKKIMTQPFPEHGEMILSENIVLYNSLPEDLKTELKKKVLVFLEEKTFEGCEGMEITDEIRFTIAGQACLLLLNRKTDCYKHLHTIMVYPAAFTSQTPYEIGGGIGYKRTRRAGESWHRGPVILSWDHVKRGSANSRDGQNVVVHEFAHQLDQEDGKSDGVPTLGSWSAYRMWGRVLSVEYFLLQEKTKKYKKHFMDKYGATNPAEFFAVATETFFEKPEKMKQEAPELYQQLSLFYKINPAEWNH